jgi:hypothetical protein
MAVYSCVNCGNTLPAYHEATPSFLDFCSERCADEMGVSMDRRRPGAAPGSGSRHEADPHLLRRLRRPDPDGTS